MNQVWSSSRNKGSALLLLLAIADHAHDDGSGAYPSVSSLARKTRMGVRSTQLLIQKLIKSRELDVEIGAGPHGVNLYRINIKSLGGGAKIAGVQSLRGRKDCRGEKIAGVKDLQGGGAKSGAEGVKPSSPKPSCKEETVMNHKYISGAVAPVGSDPVEEIFGYWQSILNHPQAKLTPERRRKIEARLEQNYTVEQIKSAIDGCLASAYHQGQNETGTIYDDIELICRNGTKLESFISRKNSNGKNRVTHKETPGERNAREYEELIRASAIAASNNDISADSGDAGEAWIPADFSRL